MRQLFEGTGQLIGLLFKQHRLKIIVWLVGLLLVTLPVAAAYPALYASPLDLMGIAITMQNPAMTAMLGPAPNAAEYTVSAAFAQEMLLFTAIAAAIMNMLLVSSMTREDEEEGRLELIRSLPVGRLSYTTAAMIIIGVINLILVLIIGFGLTAIDAGIFPLDSAMLYGLTIGLSGLFFAGVTVVAAQLSETARGTRSIAFGVLLLAYLLRAFGDVRSEFVSLFSPLGWVVRTQPFTQINWLPVIALGIGTLLLIAIGFVLNQRRDLFQGVLPDRPGKSHASPFLKTLPGLIWSQQKIAIIAWIVGIFLLAASFGAILGDLETYFADMDLLQAFLPGSPTATLTEEFTQLIIGVMAVFTAIPGITILLSLKKEEAIERIDHLYSRAVSRTKVLLTYFVAALLVVTVIQGLFSWGMFLTAEQFMTEPLTLSAFVEAALVYLPALACMIAFAALIIGWAPKATMFLWFYVAFTFVITYFGRLLSIPAWIQGLSVFYHVPEHFNSGATLWLSALALLAIIVAAIGYRLRDIKA